MVFQNEFLRNKVGTCFAGGIVGFRGLRFGFSSGGCFKSEPHSAKKCFWVAQRFQRCDRLAIRERLLAAEVLTAATPRGNTGYSVYFITASTAQRTPLFRREPMARLFVEVLFHYRDHKNYLLHEFVLMPDHFHLLVSPTLSLERSLQLIKGGFSYRAKKN